jgi:hypothetical protein
MPGSNQGRVEALSELVQPEANAFDGEWAILRECASPVCDTHRLAELAPSLDWARLLLLAEEHGVLGHLAVRLRELREDLVPIEMRQTLLELHRSQIFSTLRMTAELFRLLELFSATNVPAVVVKGPALAIQAYGDPALRSYGDLDFLVRQRNIRRATELLQSEGYRATVPIRAIDEGRIPGQYLFFNPDTQLLVELHNDYTLRYFPRRLPLEEFFTRRILVPLDSHKIPALAVEDELVYICIHGTKHLWERLSWIADVAWLVTRQSGLDWRRAIKTANEVGAERMLNTGLRLASDLLHAQLPERILTVVQEDAGAGKLASSVRAWLASAGNTQPTLFERVAFRLRMRGGLLTAPAYLLRLSLSPTEEDWGAEEELRDGRVIEIFRRPLRLIRKYSRSSKSLG